MSSPLVYSQGNAPFPRLQFYGIFLHPQIHSGKNRYSPSNLLDDGSHKLGALARLSLRARRPGLGDAGGGFLLLPRQHSGAGVSKEFLFLDWLTQMALEKWTRRGNSSFFGWKLEETGSLAARRNPRLIPFSGSSKRTNVRGPCSDPGRGPTSQPPSPWRSLSAGVIERSLSKGLGGCRVPRGSCAVEFWKRGLWSRAGLWVWMFELSCGGGCSMRLDCFG